MQTFDDWERRPHTVRDFSARAVPLDFIESGVRTLVSNAPSGAYDQTWHYVVVANPVRALCIRAAPRWKSLSSMKVALGTNGSRRWNP